MYLQATGNRDDRAFAAGHAMPAGERGGLGQPPRMVRHFVCTNADNRAVETLLAVSLQAGALRSAVEAAANLVVPWARQAAADLQVSPRSNGTRQSFQTAFGTLPEAVPTWRTARANWVDRGDLVAIRLQQAVKILSDGSITYYCWGPRHSRTPPWRPTVHARVTPGRSRMYLGEGFWRDFANQDVVSNAATLLRMALSIYFPHVRQGSARGRYGNANCYVRFVLELNNQPVPARIANPAAVAPCA
jgi:hypothetical protein